MRANVRRNIIQRSLETIEWISDKEYQKRAWIRGESPGTDFDEAVNMFCDVTDFIVENHKDYHITDIQYQMLRVFYDRFITFSDDNDWPAQFIDTTEWTEIIEMAKDVLRAFGFQKQRREKVMPLTEENKRYCLNEFLKNIHTIADKEYQRRVWIRSQGPEGDDFNELVCHFFDNSYPILLEYKDYGITEAQYQILIALYDRFSEFADDNEWPTEFINTPEWTKLTEMAKEVVQAFGYQK